MYKLKLIILTLFIFSLKTGLAQNANVVFNDSAQVLYFYKLKPSREKKDSIRVEFRLDKLKDSIEIKIYLTPLWFLVSTTLKDFFILNTPFGQYKFYNRQSHFFVLNPKLKTNADVYILKSYVSSNTLKNILEEKIINVFINFSPNSDVEKYFKEQVKNRKLDEYERHCIRLSKRNLNSKVSKPNQSQLQSLKTWIKSNF